MYEKRIPLYEHMRLFKRTLCLLNCIAPGVTAIQLMQALCQALLPFIVIFMSARILDEIAGERDVVRLAVYVGATLISAFVTVLFSSFFSYIYNRMVVKVMANQEMMLANKAYSISYKMAEDRDIALLRKSIESNAESGVGGLFEALWFTNNFFRYACAVGISLSLTAGIFTDTDNRMLVALALVVAVVIGIICINWMTVNKEIRTLYESIAESKMLYDFYMVNYMDDNQAAKDIRMFNIGKFIAKVLRKQVYQPQFAVRRSQVRKEGNHTVLTTALTALLGGTVYVFTAAQAWNGNISVGDVMQYYGGITQLISAASSLIVAFFALSDNNYCMKPLFYYLDLPEFVYSGNVPMPRFADAIEFNDISFRYAPGLPFALTHCSLRIRHGEHVAIVGRNGSGKSTLIKLLCRLYTPQSGCITIDGVDIQQVNFDDYQRHLAVVFQDYKLFAFGIGSNVAGSSHYDDTRVWKALDLSGLKNRVEQLPGGLEHVLYKDFDENGVELSGGEEQKLAIARALFKQAPILILDEPTAALDPLSEVEIYENFDRIAEDKTVIYISHRLASCKFCDSIVVFDNGEIVQIGKHEELLGDAEGLYAHLWQAQAKYYQEET